jgi:hypothetical protein
VAVGMGGLDGGDGRRVDTSHRSRISGSHMHLALITAIAGVNGEDSEDPDCHGSSAQSGQLEQLGDTPRTANQPFSTFSSTNTTSSWPPGSPCLWPAGPGPVSIPEVVQEDNATIGVAHFAGSEGGNSESVAPVPTEPPVDAWVPVQTRRSCAFSENRDRWMLLPQIDPAVTTAASSDQNPPQQQQMQEHAAGIAESAPEHGLETHEAEETCSD